MTRAQTQPDPDLLPIRPSGLRRALGWRVNRLSDGPTSLEIVGSGAGYLFSAALIGGGLILLAKASSSQESTISALAIVVGLVILVASSLSTGQFLYRRRLREVLADRGATTQAKVIDRWRLPTDRGAWSCIRFEFTAVGESIQAEAFDSTEMVRRVRIGDVISVRYDPGNPRRLLIDLPHS